MSQQLPIEAVLPDLFAAIQTCSQVILKAATGAGKSTYFPLYLLQSGQVAGQIILLEPRRLAAKNIAQYIASQLGETVGQRVGYRIRGESKVSQQTQLVIVTEGVLTRMIQADPELTSVSLVIFDEFHERSLHADTALALSLDVQQALRDDLKLVIMSATLERQALQHVLPEAAYVESVGRTFPVDYQYVPLKPNESVIAAIVRQIKLLLQREDGSLLVFLPGMGMIQQIVRQLRDLPESVDVCPLYGQLSFAQQQKAIQPAFSGRRKVVLATNIAETSLTIEGIRIVIDSGLERLAKFDPVTGVTRLEQGRISQSSAEQRAGRAGRLSAGLCVRLYSESQLKQQVKVPLPEILRSDLSALAMDIAQWGVKDVRALRWMTPPPQPLLAQGRHLLQQLGMMDESYGLTGMGQSAYTLGVDMRLASMLIKARQQGAGYLQSAIAGAVLIEELMSQQVNLAFGLHQWQSGQHQQQVRFNQRAHRLATRLGCQFELSEATETTLGLVLSLAFPDRIAQQRTSLHTEGHQGKFLLANGHGAFLREEEPLANASYLVVVDVMNFSAGNSSQILTAIQLDVAELQEVFPELIEQQTYVDWDEKKGRLIAESRRYIGKLVLKTEALPEPDAEEMTQALLNYVRRKGLKILQWDDESVQWLERVRCAVNWLPEEAWPLMDDASLLADVTQWLRPYLDGVHSVKALKQVPILAALKSRIGWELSQSLDRWLPIYHQLPTGQQKRIRYQLNQAPVLSVRIQEVFGERESPVIAKGKQRLVLELLSPAQRPIQITQDLAVFWRGSYLEVRKEMRGRYPKHFWPEDPINHIATTKTKRQLIP